MLKPVLVSLPAKEDPILGREQPVLHSALVAKLATLREQPDIGFLRQFRRIIRIAGETERKPIKAFVVQGHDLFVIQFVHSYLMCAPGVLCHTEGEPSRSISKTRALERE